MSGAPAFELTWAPASVWPRGVEPMPEPALAVTTRYVKGDASTFRAFGVPASTIDEFGSLSIFDILAVELEPMFRAQQALGRARSANAKRERKAARNRTVH